MFNVIVIVSVPAIFKRIIKIKIWAQLSKTINVVSEHNVKTLIIKYGIYANSFAEKCE